MTWETEDGVVYPDVPPLPEDAYTSASIAGLGDTIVVAASPYDLYGTTNGVSWKQIASYQGTTNNTFVVSDGTSLFAIPVDAGNVIEIDDINDDQTWTVRAGNVNTRWASMFSYMTSISLTLSYTPLCWSSATGVLHIALVTTHQPNSSGAIGCMITSSDLGVTWSAPETIVPNITMRAADYSQTFATCKFSADGTLLVSFTDHGSALTTDGQTWTEIPIDSWTVVDTSTWIYDSHTIDLMYLQGTRWWFVLTMRNGTNTNDRARLVVSTDDMVTMDTHFQVVPVNSAFPDIEYPLTIVPFGSQGMIIVRVPDDESKVTTDGGTTWDPYTDFNGGLITNQYMAIPPMFWVRHPAGDSTLVQLPGKTPNFVFSLNETTGELETGSIIADLSSYATANDIESPFGSGINGAYTGYTSYYHTDEYSLAQFMGIPTFVGANEQVPVAIGATDDSFSYVYAPTQPFDGLLRLTTASREGDTILFTGPDALRTYNTTSGNWSPVAVPAVSGTDNIATTRFGDEVVVACLGSGVVRSSIPGDNTNNIWIDRVPLATDIDRSGTLDVTPPNDLNRIFVRDQLKDSSVTYMMVGTTGSLAGTIPTHS